MNQTPHWGLHSTPCSPTIGPTTFLCLQLPDHAHLPTQQQLREARAWVYILLVCPNQALGSSEGRSVGSRRKLSEQQLEKDWGTQQGCLPSCSSSGVGVTRVDGGRGGVSHSPLSPEDNKGCWETSAFALTYCGNHELGVQSSRVWFHLNLVGRHTLESMAEPSEDHSSAVRP